MAFIFCTNSDIFTSRMVELGILQTCSMYAEVKQMPPANTEFERHLKNCNATLANNVLTRLLVLSVQVWVGTPKP